MIYLMLRDVNIHVAIKLSLEPAALLWRFAFDESCYGQTLSGHPPAYPEASHCAAAEELHHG